MQAKDAPWYLDDIGLPSETLSPRRKPIVIAIVDDGFRLSHEFIAPVLWVNPWEVPKNGIDDDGNGYIDDVSGWDVVDEEGDVSTPPGREREFYHGTHLAGIIAEVMQACYGDAWTEAVRILPVKTISDQAERLDIPKAYDGVRYAEMMQPDIILCAWGESQLNYENRRLLDRLQAKGIPIIAAAGNIDQELEQFPAAHPWVLAISGHDRLGRKVDSSGFGAFVDLTAPGENIEGASPVGDSATLERSGTSYAAAIAAASLAILMQESPEQNGLECIAALMNASTTTTQNRAIFAGKLGSGKINIRSALQTGSALPSQQLFKSKAFIPISLNKAASWQLPVVPNIKGYRFEILKRDEASYGNGKLRFFRKFQGEETLIKEVSLDQVARGGAFAPGNSLEVRFTPDVATTDASLKPLLLRYWADPIDLSKQFASGTSYINEPTSLTDGSGDQSYAPATDAKWMITAPEGKRIHLNFVEFDTESNVDKVYLFNGKGTHTPIVAVLSGSRIPPEVTSWTNELLMWFVTDRENEYRGWKVEISFVDPSPES